METNRNGDGLSLAVSHQGKIPAGTEFDLGGANFYVKNLTGEAIEHVRVLMAGGEEVETTLNVGWQPELYKKVFEAPEGVNWGW